MIELIDTHCHLDLLKGVEDDVVAAVASDIQYVAVTNAPYLFEPNQRAFSGFPNVSVALGMHPQLVERFGGQLDQFEALLPQSRWVGEVGLDGSLHSRNSLQLQRTIFDRIVSMVVRDTPKVLSVHSRGAERETLEILHSHLAGGPSRVILHWYSGPVSLAELAVGYGYYFSVNHKMFSSANGRRILERIPIDRVLTETDAPFSLDASVGSQRASIMKSIKQLAQSRSTDHDTMTAIIRENFKRVLSQ
jgi:TatD DNase family protein